MRATLRISERFRQFCVIYKSKFIYKLIILPLPSVQQSRWAAKIAIAARVFPSILPDRTPSSLINTEASVCSCSFYPLGSIHWNINYYRALVESRAVMDSDLDRSPKMSCDVLECVVMLQNYMLMIL